MKDIGGMEEMVGEDMDMKNSLRKKLSIKMMDLLIKSQQSVGI